VDLLVDVLQQHQVVPDLDGPTRPVTAVVEDQVVMHHLERFDIPPTRQQAVDNVLETNLQLRDTRRIGHGPRP
jgi:hypothetical protein